jgi:hypothetical protein
MKTTTKVPLSFFIANALPRFPSSRIVIGERILQQYRTTGVITDEDSMIWIPVEIILEIFRAVQKLIEAGGAWELQEYHDNLLAFALSNKEWTAIAQAELFRHVKLKNRSKMNRLLEAARGSEKLRGFSCDVTSLQLGYHTHDYEVEGLGDDLDEIALYCPNIVDVTCCKVDVRLEYFGKC